jgi:hypothetical protein
VGLVLDFADGHRVTQSGYFTGVAEQRNGHWQFRDGGWPVLAGLYCARVGLSVLSPGAAFGRRSHLVGYFIFPADGTAGL